MPDDIILATTNSQVSVRGSLRDQRRPTPASPSSRPTPPRRWAPSTPHSGLLAAGTYTVTLRSYSAGSSGFEDALGSPLDGTDSGGQRQLPDHLRRHAPPVAVGIPDFARGPSQHRCPVLAHDADQRQHLRPVVHQPAANPTTGTATVTFSTTAATLQSNIQNALTSGGLATQIGVVGPSGTPNSVVIVTNDVSTGANVLVTFQSALAQATSQLLTSTTPGVTSGLATHQRRQQHPRQRHPHRPEQRPGRDLGQLHAPVQPELADHHRGGVQNPRSQFHAFIDTINTPTSATAVLSLSSPSPISSAATAITLGSLLATVPLSATASYGTKQLLHFSSEQLSGTGGPIAVTNQDGVQVVAYFGDVTDTGGPFTLQDAADISTAAGGVPNTAAQTLPGFAAFANLDPVIIGDVSLQGSVNSTDAGAMIQQVGGTARITIPYAPIGLPVTPVGPDPTLSVPSAVPAVSGSTLIVPVNIDTARPAGVSPVTTATDVREDVQAGTSAPPLPLGPHIDPSRGLRGHRTRMADARSAFVLHTAESSSQLAVHGGRATIPSASPLPPVIWDQAFEDLEQSVAVRNCRLSSGIRGPTMVWRF